LRGFSYGGGWRRGIKHAHNSSNSYHTLDERLEATRAPSTLASLSIAPNETIESRRRRREGVNLRVRRRLLYDWRGNTVVVNNFATKDANLIRLLVIGKLLFSY
jgi:hypothetical protein